MVIGQAYIAKRSNFLYLLDIVHSAFQKKIKTHDYTHYECGVDYMFEPVDQGASAYMTGLGKGVSQGDHIMLQNEQNTQRYKIETVDYYSSPSDMWIALLSKVSHHSES